MSRLINAAETWAPGESRAERTGVPVRTVSAPLPAIDAGPILMRDTQGRRAIPGFDGEDAAPFNVAELVRQVDNAAEAAVKAWPDLWPDPQPAPRRRAAEPDGAAEDPWCALAARRAEIAALQGVQQKQTAALQLARDEIVTLDKSATLLRASLMRQEKEAAAARKAQQKADEEKAALRAELEQTNANFAELVRQTAALNTSLDQKDKDLAQARRKAASLKEELQAKAGETDLTAAIEEAKARYYRDFDKRYAQFEAQIEKLAKMIGARDERIRGLEDENATLATRCDRLAADVHALEAEKRDAAADKRGAEEKLESQIAVVTFLDASLRAERDSAGRKIAELAADLRHERLQRAADARDSAAACKEIVRLLPKLAREQRRPAEASEDVTPRADERVIRRKRTSFSCACIVAATRAKTPAGIPNFDEPKSWVRGFRMGRERPNNRA